MKNPLENPGIPQEKEGGFEPGFTFACAGKSYNVITEEATTHEGNKYRMEIREQTEVPSATPLFGVAGMGKVELKALVDFTRTVASKHTSIEEILKAVQDHTVEAHSAASQG